LISGTGTPAGADPSCPLVNGCPDNRVMLVSATGQIVWQYGQAGVTGSGPDQLNTPVHATALHNGDILISDQGNARVIEVTPSHQIVWQYGQTGNPGNGPDQLNNPNSAELLANGHVLIADENNNRAIEVTRSHAIVATFTAGGTVSGVAFASRLPNGDTLLTDSNNYRAVEVDPADNIVWQCFTNDPSGNPTPFPTRAVRLKNGDTLISDQFNDRVIEVDPTCNITFQQGLLNGSQACARRFRAHARACAREASNRRGRGEGRQCWRPCAGGSRGFPALKPIAWLGGERNALVVSSNS
jgi:hypothetical protein